jgi:hypothetical protein
MAAQTKEDLADLIVTAFEGINLAQNRLHDESGIYTLLGPEVAFELEVTKTDGEWIATGKSSSSKDAVEDTRQTDSTGTTDETSTQESQSDSRTRQEGGNEHVESFEYESTPET